jgi:hypothetical protein
MDFGKLTQKNLDAFKALFPEDKKLQELTLDKLVQYSKRKTPNFLDVQYRAERKAKVQPGRKVKVQAIWPPTPCQLASAKVGLDLVFVILGAYGLRSTIRPSTIQKVAKVIAPEQVAFEKIMAGLAHPFKNPRAMAKAIWKAGTALYTAGMLMAIYKAWIRDLKWWDGVLYGVMSTAEIIALFGTDGVAFIALCVMEAAQVTFLAIDAADAYKICTKQEKKGASKNAIKLAGGACGT